MSTQDTKSSKSFWTTLPGILTGAAALITAVASLVGALNALGIFTPASSTPPPPPGVTSTPPPSSITFTFEPNPAKRGDEVQLHLSSTLDNATVYLNGHALQKKILANGKTYVVTIPADATSGYFELEWAGGHIFSNVRMNITP